MMGNPFYSHKFKKCALHYELGIDIVEGNLVWVEGGSYPAGAYFDISIFCRTLIHHLDQFEHIVDNDGYIGKAPERVKCTGT
jgi:hypothetical protein